MRQLLDTAIIAAAMTVFATPAFADHPRSITDNRDGNKVEARTVEGQADFANPFEPNSGIGVVGPMESFPDCLFRCRRPPIRVDFIIIRNTYFADWQGITVTAQETRVCADRHFCGIWTPKLGSEGIFEVTSGNELIQPRRERLPIKGVLTEHQIIDERFGRTVQTAIGDHHPRQTGFSDTPVD